MPTPSTSQTVPSVPGAGAPATPPTADAPTVTAGASTSQGTLAPVSLVGTATPAAGRSIASTVWTLTETTAAGVVSDQSGILTTPTALTAGFTPAGLGYVYSATLTATDDLGQTGQATRTVQVRPAALAAAFSVNSNANQNTNAPFTLGVTITSSTGVVSYSWRVNGSTTGLSSATAAAPTFTPSIPGIYTASCVLTDDAGSTARVVGPTFRSGDADRYWVFDPTAAGVTFTDTNGIRSGAPVAVGTDGTFDHAIAAAGAQSTISNGVQYGIVTPWTWDLLRYIDARIAFSRDDTVTLAGVSLAVCESASNPVQGLKADVYRNGTNIGRQLVGNAAAALGGTNLGDASGVFRLTCSTYPGKVGGFLEQTSPTLPAPIAVGTANDASGVPTTGTVYLVLAICTTAAATGNVRVRVRWRPVAA